MLEPNIPLTTIGIACFNCKETVERAIENAINQSWENKEIIIVDDASTDGTRAVLSNYKDVNNVHIYYREKNGGIGQVRNDIIKYSSGEFLVFFDDDDESCPLRISEQIKRIQIAEQNTETSAPVICYSGRQFISKENKKVYIPPIHKIFEGDAAIVSGRNAAEFILTGLSAEYIYGSTATCTLLCRLSSFKYFGGFDQQLTRSEDTDFAIRAGLGGADFVPINSILVTQHSSIGQEKSPDNELKNIFLYLEKYESFINSNSSLKFCKAWTELKFSLGQNNYTTSAVIFFKLILFYPHFFLKRGWYTLRLKLIRHLVGLTI